MTTYPNDKRSRNILSYFKESLNSEHQDYTTGSIQKAIFMLAVPMILEMCMESVFAVVDIFFVTKLGANATATVGLTESILSILYSLAFGLSIAASAMVARRVGEKNYSDAAKSGAQAIFLAGFISLVISLIGIFFSDKLLALMGANAAILSIGSSYAKIMLTGNIVIMLLFLINGIFRGAGDAAIAMRSLWVANLCNIILCPIMIHFYGLPGAAIATTIGRGTGVCYQVYHLYNKKGIINILRRYFIPNPLILKSLLNIASTATLQFLIGSASWIAMARIISGFGSNAIAGYTIAIRLLIFFLMPAWGLSNAAATLVGQNLGAHQPARAEKSVWTTAKYNAIFMGGVSLLFITSAEFFVGLLTSNTEVIKTAVIALRIVSCGYIFYGVGMVMMNAFNGAGDSKTPTWINLFWFWIFQIPFAYFLSGYTSLGSTGVFVAIVVTETCITISSVILFKKAKWKTVKV